MDIRGELLDRFGKTPPETKSFIKLAVIRLLYFQTPVRVITINKNSVVFELGEKDLKENIVNNILNYKNRVVLNKKFKESSVSSLLVFFETKEGFDWNALIVDCNSLFCVQ